MKNYLGMRVTRTQDTFRVDQSQYARDVVKKFSRLMSRDPQKYKKCVPFYRDLKLSKSRSSAYALLNFSSSGIAHVWRILNTAMNASLEWPMLRSGWKEFPAGLSIASDPMSVVLEMWDCWYGVLRIKMRPVSSSHRNYSRSSTHRPTRAQASLWGHFGTESKACLMSQNVMCIRDEPPRRSR